MRRRKFDSGASPPPVPPHTKSLIGCRFGRLLVQFYAGADKHGKSLWCCLCDCGAVLRVPGHRLLGTGGGKDARHPQRSCGCERADPGVRMAARLRMPAARRKEKYWTPFMLPDRSTSGPDACLPLFSLRQLLLALPDGPPATRILFDRLPRPARHKGREDPEARAHPVADARAPSRHPHVRFVGSGVRVRRV